MYGMVLQHKITLMTPDNWISYWKNHISATFLAYQYWISTMTEKAANMHLVRNTFLRVPNDVKNVSMTA